MWLLVPDWCAVLAWLKTLDYGDVPTWASTVVSAAALGAAWFAARASWKVLTIETERDNDADEREQRAQADLVAAWLANDTPENRGAWNVVVANESKVPIYDVEVNITSRVFPLVETNSLSSYASLVPPGRIALPFPSLIRRIMEEGNPTEDQQKALTNPNAVRLVHQVHFTFRDAAGIKWMRSNFGVLRRAHDPDEVRGDDLL